MTDVDSEVLATFPEGLEILTGNGLTGSLFSVVLEAFVEAYKVITDYIKNNK